MEYSQPVSTPLGRQSRITLNSGPLELQTPALVLLDVNDKELFVCPSSLPESLAAFFRTVHEHNQDWYQDQNPKRSHKSMDIGAEKCVFKIKGYTRWYCSAAGESRIWAAENARPGQRVILKVHAPFVWLTRNQYGSAWCVNEVCVLDG